MAKAWLGGQECGDGKLSQSDAGEGTAQGGRSGPGTGRQQEPRTASSPPLALQSLHVKACWKVLLMSRVFSWDLPGIS